MTPPNLGVDTFARHSHSPQRGTRASCNVVELCTQGARFRRECKQVACWPGVHMRFAAQETGWRTYLDDPTETFPTEGSYNWGSEPEPCNCNPSAILQAAACNRPAAVRPPPARARASKPHRAPAQDSVSAWPPRSQSPSRCLNASGTKAVRCITKRSCGTLARAPELGSGISSAHSLAEAKLSATRPTFSFPRSANVPNMETPMHERSQAWTTPITTPKAPRSSTRSRSRWCWHSATFGPPR